MHRFLLPDFQIPALVGHEAHHARDVLRLAVGDSVNVFDGRGHQAECRIIAISKTTVRLTPPRPLTSSMLPCHITLAQAIPKKNMDLIVQKATELGVAAIMPLMSERTVVSLDKDSKKMERWREIALDACKQCGNNWLPEIQPPQKTRDFIEKLGPFDLKLIASLQPDAQPLKVILQKNPMPLRGATILVLIGPEGDFTPAELSVAKNAGCLPLTLGSLVLRADTAALYTLSILHHELQNR